jgi:hypothetical protein
MWRCVVLALIMLTIAGCSPAARFQHPVTGAIVECDYFVVHKQEICINSWLASGYIPYGQNIQTYCSITGYAFTIIYASA